MMFPLCTIVTLERWSSNAYKIAARISLSVPSLDTGFIPKAVVSGKRILSADPRRVMNSKSSFASGLSYLYSIPA